MLDEARARRARIQGIVEGHGRRMKELDRSGARLAVMTCPPIVLGWSLVAWLDFAHGDMVMGGLMVAGALAFLVMMIVALVRARP